MGIYIPIGILGRGVQTVIKAFVPSHMALALRQIFTEKSLDIVFSGAPVEAVDSYKEMYGISMNFLGFEVSVFSAIAVVLLIGIVFNVFSLLRIRKYKV